MPSYAALVGMSWRPKKTGSETGQANFLMLEQNSIRSPGFEYDGGVHFGLLPGLPNLRHGVGGAAQPAAVPLARAPAPSITLLACTSGRPALVRRFPVTLPAGARAVWVSLSPTGDRLAWLIETNRDGLLALVMRRFSPNHPLATRPPTSQASLWVSRVDGTNLRRVGGINLGSIPSAQWHNAAIQNLGPQQRRAFVRLNTPRDGPQVLRWMPGGHRVSFVYQDKLWTVPVTD
jgi:hypothetical protein